VQILLGHLGLENGAFFDIDPATLQNITGLESFGTRSKFGESNYLFARGHGLQGIASRTIVTVILGHSGHGGWPRGKGSIPTAIDDDATLVDGDEIVGVIRTSKRLRISHSVGSGPHRTWREGTSRVSIGGIFLVGDFEGRCLESSAEREHVLKLAFLKGRFRMGRTDDKSQKEVRTCISSGNPTTKMVDISSWEGLPEPLRWLRLIGLAATLEPEPEV
jgi:hypothetical protein